MSEEDQQYVPFACAMTAASSLPCQDNVPAQAAKPLRSGWILWLCVLATPGVLSPVVPVVGYELSIWLMAGTLQQPGARAGFFTHDWRRTTSVLCRFWQSTASCLDCVLVRSFSFTDIRATSLFKKAGSPF